MKNLVLIDGNSIMNRAFYGIMASKLLITKEGIPTNAVFGFLSILFKLLEDINAEYLAISFDLKGKTKRHEIYSDYKANRKGMPEELAVQMPIIKNILRAMNIKIVEKEGVEADDILGTISKMASKENFNVVVLTGDRDYFQLAEEHITIRMPRTKAGKNTIENYNRDKILEEYELEPEKLIEVKGLMGDTSDNIPGVPGVGEKTAITLIKKFNSIDKIYEILEASKDTLIPDIKGKLREKLEENRELAFLSKELGRIDINVELDVAINDLVRNEWNNEEVYKLFKELSFNKYIEKFNLVKSIPEENFDDVVAKNNGQISFDTLITNIDNGNEPNKNMNTSINEINSVIEEIKNSKKIFFYANIINVDNQDRIVKKEIENVAIFSEISKKIYNIKKEQFIEHFKIVMEDETIEKIGYKLKELYIILKEENIIFKNISFDILVAAYLLNSTESKYSIEKISLKYLDVVETNENNYSEYIYNLYKILNKKLVETEQLDLFNNIEMPLVEVLAEMQLEGILINKEELVAFGDKLKIRIDELKLEIYNLANGIEFNILSPKQLGEILFEKLNLPIQRKTKIGYSTDNEVLEKLKLYHPIIEKILEFRHISKLNSTYVEGMISYIHPITNRIHSAFHQTVTSTGRISSSDPNLQNIPTKTELGKQLRKVFKAKDGYTYLDADYSQVELRVLAHIAKDPTMINAFKNDEDIHRQVASKVFNTPYNEVSKEQRSCAKAVNFGIVYGISDFGLSEQLGVSRKLAKEYIEQYLSKYSGIKEFMDNTVRFATENGYVETLYKRKRYITELKSTNFNLRNFGKRAAMNTPIQGTAADIMKLAMINIYNSLKSENLKSKIVLQVHDEILVETLEEEKDTVKNIIKNEMENVVQMEIKLLAEVEEGKDWFSAK